jgi:hypothetical protein
MPVTYATVRNATEGMDSETRSNVAIGPGSSPEAPPIGVYRHWKGPLYLVLGYTSYSTVPHVVYVGLASGETWIRSVEDWNSTPNVPADLDHTPLRFTPVTLAGGSSTSPVNVRYGDPAFREHVKHTISAHEIEYETRMRAADRLGQSGIAAAWMDALAVLGRLRKAIFVAEVSGG